MKLIDIITSILTIPKQTYIKAKNITIKSTKRSFGLAISTLAISTIISSNAWALSPPNLNADIPWGSTVNPVTPFGSVTDIASAFNAARRAEEAQFGLTAGTIADLQMPSQATWDLLSDDVKGLYLLNDEREARDAMQVGVIGLPFAGVEFSIDEISRHYANILHDNDLRGHTRSSTPLANEVVGTLGPADRIDDDLIIGSPNGDNETCHSFITRSENLAYFASSNPVLLPIERAIYSWIYDDAQSNWGHREAALLQDETLSQVGSSWGFSNDNGAGTSEGFLGFHHLSSTDYQPFANANFGNGSVVVMNIFDPVSDADATSGNCVYNVTLTDAAAKSAVLSANQAPTATDDTVTTAYETASISIDVLFNDTDPDGDTLSVTANTNPTSGSVTQTGNNFVYTPNNGFSGTDSFTYTISDGTNTDTATVNITVSPQGNQAPTANNDLVQITTSSPPPSFPLPVLLNDTDPENDTLSITTHSDPLSGTVTQSGNNLSYTPNNGFSGSDSFTYTISDGTSTDTATVNITVSQAPTATNDTVTTAYETASASIDVLANDTDPEGNALSVTANTIPTSGSVTQTGNNFVYTPNNGFSGSDSFNYTISNGTNTDRATVNITVSPQGNQAPTATDDTITTAYETASASIDVLANDTDPEGNTLSVTANTNPTSGSVTQTGSNFVYTPNNGFSGSDSFNYTISDGTNTDTATVNITVSPQGNQAPTATDDTVTTAYETASASIDVLANDTDPEGNTLSVTANTNPTSGSVTQTGNNFVYTPNNGFSGTDNFTYTISDGTNTDTATVNITVTTSGNAFPIAVDDSLILNENTTATTGNVLLNDTDADGDALTITAFDATLVTEGTVVNNGDGTFTYTPIVDFVGTNSFTYTLSDGKGGTAIGTVTLTVIGDCFIATAAFGSYLAPDVKVLRHFRDNYLLTNELGKGFVAFYYATSPPIADYIAERDSLRAITRWLLTPVIYAIKYPAGTLLFILLLIVGWKNRHLLLPQRLTQV